MWSISMGDKMGSLTGGVAVDSAPVAEMIPVYDELIPEAARCLLLPLLNSAPGTAEIKRTLKRSKREQQVFGQLGIPIERARLVKDGLEPLVAACSQETTMAQIACARLKALGRMDLVAEAGCTVAQLTEISETDSRLAAWALFAVGQSKEPGATKIFARLIDDARTCETDEPDVVRETPESYVADSEDMHQLLEAITRVSQQLGALTDVVSGLARTADAAPKKPIATRADPGLSVPSAKLDSICGRLDRLEHAVSTIGERLKTSSERGDRTGQRVKKIAGRLDEIDARIASPNDLNRVSDAIAEMGRMIISVGQGIESIETAVGRLPDELSTLARVPDPDTTSPMEALQATETSAELVASAVTPGESVAQATEDGALELLNEKAEAAERARFAHHDEAVTILSALLAELLKDNPEYMYVDGHNTIVEPLKLGFADGIERDAREWLIQRMGDLMELVSFDRVWLAFDTRHPDSRGDSSHEGLEVHYRNNSGEADGADEFISTAIRTRSPFEQGVVFTSDHSHIWPAVSAAYEDGYSVTISDATLLFTVLRVLDEVLDSSDLGREGALTSLPNELADLTPSELRELDLVGLLGFSDPAIRAFSQYQTQQRRLERAERPERLFDDRNLRSAAELIRKGDISAAYDLLDRAEFSDKNTWDIRPLRAAANLVEGEWREAKRIAGAVKDDPQSLPERRFEARCIEAVADALTSGVAADASQPLEWLVEFEVHLYHYGSSVLRVLDEALTRSGELTGSVRTTLSVIRSALAPGADLPMSEAQHDLLRDAGDALSEARWTDAAKLYQQLEETGIPARHRVLNRAMVAIGAQRYSDAQAHVREYRTVALTPNLQVTYACIRCLACAGAGDEVDIDAVRSALKLTNNYIWQKAPVRRLTKGLLRAKDGYVRDAAQELESLMVLSAM